MLKRVTLIKVMLFKTVSLSKGISIGNAIESHVQFGVKGHDPGIVGHIHGSLQHSTHGSRGAHAMDNEIV